MADIYELIGRRVREERKRLGLSIEKLADLAAVTPSFRPRRTPGKERPASGL